MDRLPVKVNLKEIEKIIKLMRKHDILDITIGDIKITCAPKVPTIKQQIMNVSPLERQAAMTAFANHKPAMDILNNKPSFTNQTEMDEFDSLLFLHENI
jgi:hypothetical protein